jgi:Lipocalin-like domain
MPATFISLPGYILFFVLQISGTTIKKNILCLKTSNAQIDLSGKWRFTGSADDSNKNGRPDNNEIINGVNYYNKTIEKEKVEKLFDTYFHFTDNNHCNYITLGKVKFAYTYKVSGNTITLTHINSGSLEDEIFTLDDKTGYLLTISPLYREELGDVKSWGMFKKLN